MKRCAKCPKAPVVGVGNPVRWVCMDHYVEYLRDARKVADAAMNALGTGGVGAHHDAGPGPEHERGPNMKDVG